MPIERPHAIFYLLAITMFAPAFTVLRNVLSRNVRELDLDL